MHLLTRLFNSSIKTKVVALIMLVVSFVIALALAFMLLVQYLGMKQVVVDETSHLARIIANRCSLAVSFRDRGVALESLNALAESPSIQQAVIFDLNGERFATYQLDGVNELLPRQKLQVGVYDDFSVISITQEIVEGDEVLGYLFLQSNLSIVWLSLGLLLLYTLVLYLICLLLSLFLALRLQRYISAPILSLLNTSKRISSEHDYEIRAEKIRNDEVGLLVDQFNQMLSIIDGNEKVLKNSNIELERKVEARTKDLEKALHESKAANHAKSVFLSHMSHELRTPLNAINGYSQILVRQENLTTSQRKQLETIYKCGDHLLHLINDVLDYSHIEAGHFEVEHAPFNLLLLLRRVSDMMRLQADQKDLYFDFSPADDLPETVVGDGRRVSQVLLNILSNAIKYTVRGTIHFRVYLEQHSHLIFEVEDSGVGIADDLKEQVFTPFFRASNTKKMVDGLGLGMAISKEFVGLMHGEIELESVAGVGSTFRVRLPLHLADCEESQGLNSYQYITGYEGRLRKLLLVDDNISNLSVLVAVLEPIGFEVHTIDDAQKVCQAVREFAPDALLLDLEMPHVDGVQVIKDLQAIKYTGKLIGISASDVYTTHQNDFVAQCDYFVTKPINADELVLTLEEMFALTWTRNSTLSPCLNSGRKHRQAGDYQRPPEPVLQELRTYVEEGNFAGLIQALKREQASSTDCAEFYNDALIYAENFDDESLFKLLSEFPA